MLTLYQFTCSHYCEKARWALDWKAVPYQTRNLVVGLHRRTVKKLAPKSSVPLLVDDSKAVQGSAAIISHLDEKYPENPLTPEEPEARRAALEWESYLDSHLGVPIRLYLYHHILPDRDVATQYLSNGMPWWTRPVYRLIFPKLRDAMTRMMKIEAKSAEQAERTLHHTMEKLNRALDGRGFLAGDRFSRADLTACALLSWARLSPYRVPPVLDSFYREIEDQRCFQWSLHIYRQYRQRASAVPD